jgi:uncharacterized protein
MRRRRRTGPTDVEDRRGLSGRPGLQLGFGATIVLLILSFVFKQDFFSLLGGGDALSPGGSVAPAVTGPEEDRVADFVEFVVGDAQDTWTALLGADYRRARLVLFRAAVQSGCGNADAAMGPFYCPADERVYIDLAIRQAIQQRPDRAGSLSVAVELQADCLAGIWAHSTARRNLLEGGDIEEGLQAAFAVGDDRIQEVTTGEVNPDSFTHGSAADRSRWFRRGFDTGRLDASDTFAGGR